MPRVSILLLVSAALVSPGVAQSPEREVGRLNLDPFTSAQFGEFNRTVGIVQDRAGILYAGNQDVVLAYDGQSWRSLPTGGTLCEDLAIDAQDRIWVASVTDFGSLEDDHLGGRTFRSLRPALPPEERAFGQFLRVETCSHGVYFFADRAIVRWHEGRATVLHDLHGIAPAQDDLIFAVDRAGTLQSFDGTTWRDFIAAPELRTQRLTSIVRVDGDAWIVATARDGLWRFRGGQLARFPTEIDGLLGLGRRTPARPPPRRHARRQPLVRRAGVSRRRRPPAALPQ